MASRYAEVYAAWQRDPQAFWAAAARDIASTRRFLDAWGLLDAADFDLRVRRQR